MNMTVDSHTCGVFASVDSPAAAIPFESAAQRLPARGLNRRALQQVLDHMDQHLGDPLSLEDLARSIGVSRFHFARLFRVTTGESPMEFLLRTRIERAKEILRGGGRRMCEIATSLGFCDQSHFSRSFRRHEGMTPRQFARLQSNDIPASLQAAACAGAHRARAELV